LMTTASTLLIFLFLIFQSRSSADKHPSNIRSEDSNAKF
jgi:hypothetical protein